jgi:hypothetical protein
MFFLFDVLRPRVSTFLSNEDMHESKEKTSALRRVINGSCIYLFNI